MVDFHRLKNLGTDIIGRAGDIAEQAKDKVVPLAEQAKEKVVPLAGKAKDVAAKGVDKAAGGLDSATGHKYHDKLGSVAGNRDKNPAPGTASTGPLEPHAEDPAAGIVADTVDPGDPAAVDGALAPQGDASEEATDASATEDGGVDGSPTDGGATEDASATDDGVTDASATEATATDASAIEAGATDGGIDGDVEDRPPTPADMPPHRPSDDAS
jgi:hypothetical protein